MNLKVLNWNIEWARLKSQRGRIIKNKIERLLPDLICLTETYNDFLEEYGYTIFSNPDYGYANTDGKHKVILWSKNKWDCVSTFEDYELPKGRIVYGRTNTMFGELNVLGLCIPWKDAHVSTGNKNRVSWEDYLKYLEGLEKVLENEKFQTNTVIIGDFNQRIPENIAPRKFIKK